MSRSSREGRESDSLSMKRAEARIPVHPLNRMEWEVPEQAEVTGGLSRAAQAQGALHEMIVRLKPLPGIPPPAAPPMPRGDQDEHYRLRWSDRTDEQGTRRTAKPTPRLLLTFAGLAEANRSKFKTFAQRYGPLGLCRHGKPSTHVPFDVLWDLFGEDSDIDPCGWPPGGDEGLHLWRRYARQADTMLTIASRLEYRETVPIEDWLPLRGLLDEPVQAWAEDPEYAADLWPDDSPGQRQHKMVNKQRAAIARAIDEWLRLAGIRPRFWWEPRRPVGLDFVGPGTLFGALAVQLADSLSSGIPPMRCTNCARLYKPSRRPSHGQDNYCPRKACQASRKTRYHRRKRDD